MAAKGILLLQAKDLQGLTWNLRLICWHGLFEMDSVSTEDFYDYNIEDFTQYMSLKTKIFEGQVL